jgi:calcineurin-like phosphoesterase family protein
MFRRLWKLLALVLAASVVALPAGAAGAPPSPPRIVAVGDLHGDFAAWRAIAEAAGLVDRKGRWAGGATVLVQTGDVVDRGPDSLKIVQDLMRLQREAPRKGGRVVALVGNHEAMNMTGDLRYVSAGDYAAFVDKKSAQRREEAYARSKAAIEATYRQRDPAMSEDAVKQAWFAATPLGLIEHQMAWRPEGKIGRWVLGNPAVAELGGNLFVHGGLCPPYVGVPLADLNRQVAAALAAQPLAPAIFNDEAGPLWCRRLAATDPAVGDEVAQVLAAYGAKRIVIGHTPILSGIAVLYDGRLVRIDTGISAVYGGKLTYLEIVDGKLVPHVVDRPAAGQGGAM